MRKGNGAPPRCKRRGFRACIIMNALELFQEEMKAGRRNALLLALFYGREDFALLPYHVTDVTPKEDGVAIFLVSAGNAGREKEHFSMNKNLVQAALHVSPEKLLSHPEHLMVTGVREGSAFSFVSTYSRSQQAEDLHLLSLLHEFLAWTGISTLEDFRKAEEDGAENAKRAEEGR